MALTNFGFIVRGDGFDPESDVQVMETPSFRMTTIGISQPEQGGDAARRLVADGAQLIELCGAFGPIWTAKVIEAIDDAVPVGSVAYGPEAIARVHAIFVCSGDVEEDGVEATTPRRRMRVLASIRPEARKSHKSQGSGPASFSCLLRR